MNEIVNKFLLAGGICMPEMHLRQTGFTYSVRETFTKIKERIKKIKKQEIHDIFVKTNYMKLVLSMILLKEISKI